MTESAKEILYTTFFISGILFWVLAIILIFLRIKYGKEWYTKGVSNLIVGNGLISAFKKTYEELPNKLQKETLAELSAHLVWRVTRIHILALVIALTPTILLIIQNNLVRNQNELFNIQNDLFEAQNTKIDKQIELFEHQNERIDEQTTLLDSQIVLFNSQNNLFLDQNSKLGYQSSLFENQNYLLDKQNKQIELQNELSKEQNSRIRDQTFLQEANRRGSLVFLLNNTLDKIDEEIKNLSTIGDTSRTLSSELIGRIASLSVAFKPYYYFDQDKLTDKLISPERGQLLLTLLNSDLNTETLTQIFSSADFSYSQLINTDLRNITIRNINLRNSDFSGSNFYNVEIRNSNLSGSIFNDNDINLSLIFNTNLENSTFEKLSTNSTNFYHVDFDSCYFKNSTMTNTTLDSGTTLKFAVVKRADIPKDADRNYIGKLGRTAKTFSLIDAPRSKLTFYLGEEYFSNLYKNLEIDSIYEGRTTINSLAVNIDQPRGILFEKTNLSNSLIKGYVFENSIFSDCSMIKTQYKGVVLKNTSLTGCVIDISDWNKYFEKSEFPQSIYPLKEFYYYEGADISEELRNTLKKNYKEEWIVLQKK